MQAIVEIDGVLFDVQAATWEAYSRAVAEIGLARTEESALWRLVRTGGADGQMVRGARPHQLERFRAAFDAALEDDAVIAKYVPHIDWRESLDVLRGLGPYSAVTAGSNLAARHILLRGNSLGEVFPQLTQAPAPAPAGAAALREIAARHADERLVVVFASSVELARYADEAGMVPIGISSGRAIGKRLAGAGARATYADLEAFAGALEKGDEALRRAGLVF
ncbi:MAG TPA: hypothetical protein P5572_13540 [Phycisphaerae bacterium]|nr:hypothetical protein [Phycisphaerae bacterium]